MGTMLEQVLWLGIISTAVVVAFIVAAFIFIRWALKDDKRFRLIFSIMIEFQWL